MKYQQIVISKFEIKEGKVFAWNQNENKFVFAGFAEEETQSGRTAQECFDQDQLQLVIGFGVQYFNDASEVRMISEEKEFVSIDQKEFWLSNNLETVHSDDSHLNLEHLDFSDLIAEE